MSSLGISTSRPPWLLQRLREGYVLVRNVRNLHQVSRIELTVETVACMVFWTKNPTPLMEHLGALTPYPYYMHFTITPYGSDIEPKIPPMGESIDSFKTIGNERVIWRYGPIFINKRYPIGLHTESFSYIARNLKGYTHRCVSSFLDIYHHLIKVTESLEIPSLDDDKRTLFTRNFALQSRVNEMELQTCAEPYDFSQFGITATSCIDGDLIEHLSRYTITKRRDPNQRKECGCASSVDIGI